MSQDSYDDFYSNFADNYDLMTNDANRWGNVKKQYKKLLENIDISNILDAGCGTGGEAITLAELGYKVTGVDASQKFINIAARKAEKNNSHVDFKVGDLRNLAHVTDEQFDLILCRGNTLPHFLNHKDLAQAMAAFKRVLKKNGILILQWLNYVRILKDKQRMVGVTERDGIIFARFYDFLDDFDLKFNVLIISQKEGIQYVWHETALKAWTGDDVGVTLNNDGWNNLEVASDILRSDFDPDSSKDIVIFAIK